jgi:ABC-2 type transport system permease protein
VAFGGLAYGSITDSIGTFVADNPTMAELLAPPGGGTLVESYLATSIRVTALIGSGFAVQSMLRLRAEEVAQRAEPLLAAAVSRWRWAGAHLAVALGGSVVVLAVLGLAIGGSAAVTAGEADLLARSLLASLAYAPATWLVVGVVAALSGLVPRLAPAGWAVVAFGFVLAMFGALLDLPAWVEKLSPFDHVPLAPASALAITPLLVLSSIAVALSGVGMLGLRRRDVS